VRGPDLARFTGRSVVAHRMRALLTALGIAVGVAAVVLLTSIGEGVRRFVVAEFTQFGTNLVSVTPGTTQTMGGSIGVFGTGSLWPDFAVAAVLAGLGITSGRAVVAHARAELARR